MNLRSDSSLPDRVPVHTMGRDLLIEYQWIAPEKKDADLLVFLHEGLGSLAMWKDWPAQLCRATNCRGLVFSRYGYGASTPRPHDEKWPVDYLQIQAHDALPAFFKSLNLEHERPILFGHSDGGTIALLYAAMYPESVKAIAVAAPHIFVEDLTIDNIKAARQTYLSTDLRGKLARYHQDPDSAFWAWNDTWLEGDFRAWNIESFLGLIRCPVLAIQGQDDHYGTLEQIRGIKRAARQTELYIVPDCGHSPHKDQPQAVIDAVVRFIASLD